MWTRAAVTSFAFALATSGMFLNVIRGDRHMVAFGAERETATAEEGVRPCVDRMKRSEPRRPRSYEVAPYPQTPIGEERLRELKQLHRDKRGEVSR